MSAEKPATLALLAQEPFSASWVWYVLAVLLAASVVYVLRYQVLVRLPLWLWSHTLYRIHVQGLENIPATGGRLLVCNHVSWIDALLIQSVVRRPVRFLIWAPFVRMRGVGLILRMAQVIPIDSSSGPRAILHSLRSASEALARGELVCIFAEGGLTRTGFLLPFQRGFEQILKRCPAPIVPVCLDHVWGSVFSYRGGKFFWKWPQKMPYPVSIAFGSALAAQATPFEVRQTIQGLSAEISIARWYKRLPVHRQFVRMATRHPFRSCLIDQNIPNQPILTYGRTLAGVKIFRRRLKKVLGDAKMVGVWMPSSAGGAMCNIALAMLGKTSVNLNYTSSMELVQSAIKQCGIRQVLTSRLFVHKVKLDPGPDVELIYLDDFRKDVSNWERLRTYLGVLLLPRFVQEYVQLGLRRHTVDDLATVIFSSGSTGEPKGVMLTHGNIAANVESMIQAIDPTPRDRILAILPFFHSFGYSVTLWVPLQVGASTIYHANPLQAKEVGELCRQFHATIFLSTPTFLRSYMKRCDPADFASLRLLICGAEKLPQSLAQEFKQRFGVLPMEGYGCTELSPVVAANVPDYQHGAVRQVGNKPGTIGQPIPGVAVRIAHRDTLQSLPPGQEGLLLVRGANVMKGYLGRDDLTQKKIVNGWYITGDLARLDEDGFITITGRQERFAKVGGEMVPLERVEEELHIILQASERTVVVTAIPDEKKGERIVVLHLPLPGVDGQHLWQQLNSRGLPNLYLPSQRDFYQVLDLPTLGTGKLDLKKCKDIAASLARA